VKNIFLPILLLAGFASTAQVPPVLVHDIDPGKGSSLPAQLTSFNGKLYFIADDGAHGRELWSYSGSAAPGMVYDLNPDSADGAYLFIGSPQPMAVLNGKLYFAGNDGASPSELYEYDGINAPVLAAGFSQFIVNANPGYLTVYGSKLYFVAAETGGGNELYVYDGINTPVKVDINSGTAGSYPHELTPLNGKLVFRARQGAYGDELFAYDTSAAMVSLVKDINSGSLSSNPISLTVFNSKVYFFALEPGYGFELHSYDGTTTTRLTDLAPGALGGVFTGWRATRSFNNDLYFTGSDNGVKFQLYKYSPATGSATLVHAFNSTTYTPPPSNFTIFNGYLYFNASASNGIELWRTDGTTTSQVSDMCPGNCNSRPSEYYVWNNDLYFSATTSPTGYELYRFHDTTGSSLGVAGVSFAGGVQVYPNPTHADATLELSLPTAESLAICLTDLSGRSVWAKNAERYNLGKTSIALPTKDLPAGMYFYRVHNSAGAQVAAGKVMVQ